MPRRFSAPSLAAALLVVFAAAPGQAEKNLTRPPGTTRYAAMVRQLKSLVQYDRTQGAHRMTLTSIGRSVKGRTLWMVTLRDPAATAPKRLLCLCRQHGHEPASTEGALTFIKALVKAPADSPLAGDLHRVAVSIVPMANPDGAEAFLRHNAHDVDLNRDWIKRGQPETQALYREIKRLKPDWMTDQHELYPNDPRPDFTETAGDGSGASPGLIAECDSTQDVVQGALRAEGYPTISHRIDDHHLARLAHRYGCVVAGVPTILFETNRYKGSGRTVTARAAAQEQFMTDMLRDVAGQRDQLLAEAAAWQAVHERTVALASRKKEPTRSSVSPGNGGRGAAKEAGE